MIVLDNSVALAWCFEDEATPELSALLDRVIVEGAVAPQLWPIEALNGLLTAERRGRITPDDHGRLMGALSALPIQIDAETATLAWTNVMAVAQQHRLTAYDAAYLELAIRLQLPLATRDAKLRDAAGAAGVAVV